MRCERAQELFSDYCEGTVQRAVKIPLEDHLSTCASCREQVEGLKEIWLTLDSAPLVEPPPDFRATVWQRIEADEARRKSQRRPLFAFEWRTLFTRPALGWAAAILLVIALAGVMLPGHYTAARMPGLWSILSSHKPATQVSVGAARNEVYESRPILRIPITVNSSDVSRIQVSVEGQPSQTQVLLLDASGSATATIDAPPAPATISLRVTWTENDHSRTKVFSVTPR